MRLRPLPFRKVRRALRHLGFMEVRQHGSHVVFEHADGRVTVVAHHAREEIQIGTLRSIIDQARVTVEEFLARV